VSATIRGAEFVIELYISGAWQDIKTTSADWQWGAPEALGPLTECEGGTLRVSMWDPEREYDPDNPDSPLLGLLKPGLGARVTVDGQPAWTGALQSWGWDRRSKIADLNCFDPIGMLAMRALPEGQTLAPVMATSASQAQFMLDLVEWPAGKRYFPGGTAGIERGNHFVEGPVLDGLHRIRFAELGRLFPMRDGRVGWYTRAGPTPPAPSVTINCGGVGLTELWRVMGLGRVRNHIVINGGYGVLGPVLPPDEYRSVITGAEFLQLAVPATVPPGLGPLPHDIWGMTILDALEQPPPLTMLGTILPVGGEIADVVTAEFGDRWTVSSPDGDTEVQVYGQHVTIAPDYIEVDVVTEDVYVSPPVAHLVVGAGSGFLSSSNDISYANARAGVAVVLGSGTNPYVGQRFAGGTYTVEEAFVWFDTSSIPAGATILSAEFAAMVHPYTTAGTPPAWDLEVRSYSAGGWRPTLAVADWVPGASMAASYPLRAKWTINVPGYENFHVFADAGSGLAGAIVKGGATQLLLTSSRTVAGTAPTTTYESVFLDFIRLRVTYTLP
jgi:hypothetical protein